MVPIARSVPAVLRSAAHIIITLRSPPQVLCIRNQVMVIDAVLYSRSGAGPAPIRHRWDSVNIAGPAVM